MHQNVSKQATISFCLNLLSSFTAQHTAAVNSLYKGGRSLVSSTGDLVPKTKFVNRIQRAADALHLFDSLQMFTCLRTVLHLKKSKISSSFQNM